MYNGKILKDSCETVKGTHKMYGYSDHWDESYDIEFDGDLTAEVIAAVIAAFKASKLYSSNSCSSYGSLRWPLADSDVRVDTNTRKLIVSRGMGICD